MVLFMYGIDYERISRDRCQISPMRLHVSVYQIGDKYDVPRLKEYAREKFASAIRTCWKMDDFPVTISEAYSTTPAADRGFRNLIVGTCLQYFDKLLENDDFRAVLRETPGFAADLVQKLGPRMISITYCCPYCAGKWSIPHSSSSSKTPGYCPLCGMRYHS